ncbi:MAG: hypothetical protein HQL87_06730 [Magnetococcales bacterium]|nr:hypothetical protein [Magnetococcales bacterium]
MKKKRTDRLYRDKTDPLRVLENGFGHPALGQAVVVNSREQVPAILREIAQLERHTIAIETDAYRSMCLICRSANRFLAPRRRRMQALVMGLKAFKGAAHPKRRRQSGS